jgi:hypothetical protein
MNKKTVRKQQEKLSYMYNKNTRNAKLRVFFLEIMTLPLQSNVKLIICCKSAIGIVVGELARLFDLQVVLPGYSIHVRFLSHEPLYRLYSQSSVAFSDPWMQILFLFYLACIVHPLSI